MNFWRILKVLKDRKWYILGLAALTVIVTYLAAPEPRVRYEAASLMSPTSQVMNSGQSAAGSDIAKSNDRNVILSNLIIIASGGEVFQKAMDFLSLPEEEQEKLAPDMKIYKRITRITNDKGEAITPADWSDMLDVTPVQNPSIGEKGTITDIIKISIKTQDPDLAAYVANAVGYAFAQVFQEKNREDTRKYIAFLESSKEEVRLELRNLQQRAADYKKQHNVIAVNEETANAVASIASLQQIREGAAAEVREAQAALSDINAQLKNQPMVTRYTLPAEMDPDTKKLYDELADNEAKLRLLRTRYTPEHQAYKTMASQIEIIKARIKEKGATYNPPAINEIHQDLVKKQSEALYNLSVAKAKLASISGSVGRAQGRADQITTAEPALSELTRDLTQTEQRFIMLGDKLSQAQIAEKEFTRTGSIVPINWARLASSRALVEGPTKPALVLYALFLSLAIGMMISVWLDSIDNKLRCADDVEQLMELPVVGSIPALTDKGGKSLPKLTHMYPLSAISESYKILRTNILFELRDTPFKTLMVATGRPGQGATTTICNLAIALAQIGKKIILIDADMRRPSLHKFFGVENEAGLSTLLKGEGNLTDAFQRTEVENLIVVPAGPRPMNPSELLGSDRMQDIVFKLQEHCDLVLFDTPSTVVFSDGPMLASWIDAVLMVVAANQAPRGTEVQTRDLLKKAKANIIGVVVNKMSAESVDSCFYYSHYYSDSAPDIGHLTAGDSMPQIPKNRKKAIPAPDKKQETKVQHVISSQIETENPFPD